MSRTMIAAGTPGLDLLAEKVLLNLALGEPTPVFFQCLTNSVGFAYAHIAVRPTPPTTAIGGPALNMKRPAVHDMYDATTIHVPNVNEARFSFLPPLHISIRPYPMAAMVTMGPNDANRIPLSGAWASPIVEKTLFLEK